MIWLQKPIKMHYISAFRIIQVWNTVCVCLWSWMFENAHHEIAPADL